LNIPDPEHAVGDETEVEITDLDSGKVSARSKRQNRVPSFRARAWMSLAVIAGTALLFVAVLVSVSHLPKAARVTAPPVHINYPVSLSVVDGICYAIAPNGVVTALRVSDGSLLWRHAGGKTGEESTIVVDGVVYLAPLLPSGSNDPTVTIEALRASDGSPLWSRTLPTDSPASVQLTVVNRVVYVLSEVERIDALRASDGSLLWHYTSRMPFVSLPSVADGVVYAGTQDGHLSALRASDGFPLWMYTLLSPPQSFIPVVADGMVFLNLHGGSMDVLRADTGVLLWRYTPRTPALQLFPLPLVTHGVVYVLTQDDHLSALRASDGFTVWSVTLHATDLLPPMFVTGGVVYMGAFDGSVDALRESDGSVLWHHQGGEEGPASITVAQGVIYLAFFATSGVNLIGSITVLRASDGLVLWRYTPHVSATQLLPVVGDDLVLLALQDGSIDALRTSSGSLRWHRAMNS
jgi:outer membrane protein assembly factor BamB